MGYTYFIYPGFREAFADPWTVGPDQKNDGSAATGPEANLILVYTGPIERITVYLGGSFAFERPVCIFVVSRDSWEAIIMGVGRRRSIRWINDKVVKV